MVACIRPEPMKTIADPCCGSGGFFLAARSFLADPENYTLDREQKEFLKTGPSTEMSWWRLPSSCA